MAEVNDVFDKITDEQSFFDPTKVEKKVATNCPCPDWHPEAPEGPGCCGEVIAQ